VGDETAVAVRAALKMGKPGFATFSSVGGVFIRTMVVGDGFDLAGLVHLGDQSEAEPLLRTTPGLLTTATART
jgi:hypothetical protein